MSPTEYDFTRHLLHYIKACTTSYAAYYLWSAPTPKQMANRSQFLCAHRRDWECASALYRAERHRQMKGAAQ